MGKYFSSDDTIFCIATLVFGNEINHDFFLNHSDSATVNFPAGNPFRQIAVPFTYTPKSSDAEAEIVVDCWGYDNDGHYHSATADGYSPLPVNALSGTHTIAVGVGM